MNNQQNTTNINWYPGHMAKTKRQIIENINLIDIIYEVIDARIPFSSKIKDIDAIIKNKPRILIMTKKDLCDMTVTKKWIDYYEEKGITVIPMDLTNNLDYKLLVDKTNELTKSIQDSRIAKGLKIKEINLSKCKPYKDFGKSTLINKLAHRKVANVGNKPGVTKDINWLKTNYNILVLDTPGILWPKLDDPKIAMNLAATSAIKSEILDINDIGMFLLTFLKEYYPNILIEKYKVDSTIDVTEIMENLAKKMGYIKNNEIDSEKVAWKLYNDITSGVIKGVTFDR